MNSSVKKLEKAQVEISVEVSVEEMRPYLEKAAAKISKDTKIEGFRPGNAPYDVVVAKVGEMAILQEAIDDIISKTYYDTLQENKIVTIGQPKIDIEKLAPGNPFSYKATADILPEVKVGDYSKIKIKRTKVEVKDEQVDVVLEDLRKMQQKESLADRASKLGDKMDINFDVFLNKVAIENGAQKKYPITLGDGKFIPGFEEQITGLKAGEEKEFELSFPEKYFDKKMAGKTAEFKVKCNGVFELEMPELTDDFAKSISAEKFKSIDEVKKNIKENIISEEKQKQEQRLEIEMLDKLIEASTFEIIPDVLVDHEVSKMLMEMQQSVIKQGLQFEDYLKSLKKTEDELKQEFRPSAEQRIKSSILSREIYHQKKFDVTSDEINLEIEEMMKSYPNNPEVRKQFEAETYKDYMKNIIGNRKVLEFLKREIITD
jgi:trigger factor